jgi:hypothetical protein
MGKPLGMKANAKSTETIWIRILLCFKRIQRQKSFTKAAKKSDYGGYVFPAQPQFYYYSGFTTISCTIKKAKEMLKWG